MTKLEALEIANSLNKHNYVPAITLDQKENGYRDVQLISDTGGPYEIVFKGVWLVEDSVEDSTP
jgi:hypothetical protein